MRLLLVNALYPPYAVGGAERSVSLLAEALARDGVDVHVATLTRAAEETASLQNGVTVHRLPIDQAYWPWDRVHRAASARVAWHYRNRWNVVAARRVGRLLDRIEPDLAHTHVLTGFSAAIWPEVKRRGIPLAQTLRDYSLICPRAAIFRKGRTCPRRCVDCRLLTGPTRVASQMVDAVAANSDFTLEAHRAAGRFEKVAARRLFNIVPGSAQLREQRTQGPLRFGFLGRIEAEKGIGVLLAALPLIGCGDWLLRIGGTGREDELRRYATLAAERVEWLGPVDAGAFYRSIDVLLVPSLWAEPLPRTLVEGVAHGCSIIAARSGGIPEVAGISQVSQLYRADDPAELATAMRAAIAEPEFWRARAGSTDGRMAEFGEAAVVAAHHDFYEAARRAAQ